MPKQIATISLVKALGLQLKGNAPAFSNKGITKAELNQWYYVDNVAAGISTYPDNRLITQDELIGATLVKPVAQFYQYDVTRSGIPNANGGFFTYKAADGTTQTILQNTYGYVGRYCMQEGSFSNNQYNLYSISQVGVCYPSYGTYPQPYLVGCCLHFNNLGSYTVEDIKIYQLVTTENSKTNAGVILAGVSAVTQITLMSLGIVTGNVPVVIWSTANLLSIAGGIAYGEGNHLTNQLRYIGTGAYTNGSVCLDTIGSGVNAPQFYIAYKVKNPQGFYPVTYGYGQYENAPPGLTSNCSNTNSTAAVWTSQGYTTCIGCTNYTVYKDTNIFSTSFNKYKVNDVVGTTTAPANVACNTAATWTYVYQNCASCVNRDVYRDTNDCSATFGKYKINTDGAVQTDAPTNTGACNTAQTWTNNNTTICIDCTNVIVYKNTNPCSTNANFYRYTNPTTSVVVTQESDPSTAVCVTSANWVFQYYNCFGCTTRSVERDMNPCSSTYLGYTVNHGVNVGTVAPTNTGACNTSQIWTDTGVTRCNNCVNEKEQEQTNSCATGHTTKRWVAGGSACSTTQVWTDTGVTRCNECVNEKEQEQTNSCAAGSGTKRWVAGGSSCSYTANYSIADGTYWTCDGQGNTTANTIYKNSNGCFSGNQWSLLGTTYASKPTENTQPSTVQNWQPTPDVNGYCIGSDYYQPQTQINPCAINYGGTRDYLLEANSSACNEMYILYNCADGSTGYSIAYAPGTFVFNQRVTSNGVIYRITGTAGANLAGSTVITSTGAYGCPQITQLFSFCDGQYYWINGTYNGSGFLDNGLCVEVQGVTAVPQGTEVYNYTEGVCDCV